MIADTVGWVGLVAATFLVARAPLSLLLMCLTLRLLGVPKGAVRERALGFADQWIKHEVVNRPEGPP